MHYKLFFVGMIVMASCKPSIKKIDTPPNVFILLNDSSLKNNNGKWLYKNKPLNGFIIEKSNTQLLAKLPIINGKENGVAYAWYTNGYIKYEKHFVNGNREGVYKGWYINGSPAFVYFFKNDKYEGEQISYFESGHLWQSLHYKNGYEEGKQKSYNDSGRVINNFTVKNGKLYGVIGRYDCMSVFNKH
jgi:antitoxin component YwqK of YwqJK toxin-antitoxin module